MNQEKLIGKKTREYPIIVLGIIIHLLILVAVSDLLFPSSIDNDLKVIQPSADDPPAKRIVLFLADGLSYEAVFGPNSHKSLFLSNITYNYGSWGIAYSTFPTLRRSGHMAILTGTYEDPITAIANEWMLRPVYRDSLIQKSRHTWFWGNKQILEQFNPENLAHVHIVSPSPENRADHNKFIGHDIINFLAKIKYTISLKDSIFNKHGALFLIHMPLNTLSGDHDGIRNLDRNIEAISEYFTQAFADHSTAFVVTSAYGATSWGSHGGNSNSEIETPFIAWGAGIKRNARKIDIKQIDLAPLLACLIGVSIPVNSLGVVPLEYLDLPQEHFVSEQATNALQLANVFNSERKRIAEHTSDFYQYKDMSPDKLADHFTDLKYLHFEKKYGTLIGDCKQLIDDLLNGINYYQTYYNNYSMSCIISGYFFWIIYLIGRSLNDEVDKELNIGPMVFLILIPIYFSYVKSISLWYFVYTSFPFVTFCIALPYFRKILSHLPKFLVRRKYYLLIIYVLSIQVLLLSIFCRYVISLAMLFLGGSIFILDSYGEFLSNKGKLIWPLLCFVDSFYSSLPRLAPMMFSVSFLVYGFSVWAYLWVRKDQGEPNHAGVNFMLQNQKMCFIFASIYRIVVYFGGAGSIWVFSLISLIPLLLIPFTADDLSVRTAATIFGMLPFYLMTSSSDEPIFLAIYVVNLIQWWIIETNSSQELGDFNFDEHRKVVEDETRVIRRVLMASVFLFAGFYGAGNVFSVNSYNLLWLRSLVTNLNPTIGAFLIIVKISIPVFICVLVFHVINLVTQSNSFRLFCFLLAVFDIVIFEMLLVFVFYGDVLLKISLSHFIVMIAFTVIIPISYQLADFITTFSFLPYIQKFECFN